MSTTDTTAPVAPFLVTSSAFNFLIDPQVTLQTSLGAVVLELKPEQAPITVGNMLAYVGNRFYDNTLFHRVIPGFMVQGGGFTSGLAYKSPIYGPIPLESNNGLSNLRGTIAMARTNAANSATNQFFVNQVDNTFLNYSTTSPGYAVFGQVISGMSVIDRIASVSTTTISPHANVPVTEVRITSIRQSVAGSSITNAAVLRVGGLEQGASWSYSLDGGARWTAGSGYSFTVPVGSYAANAIRVRQVDAAGNPGLTTGKLTSALVVDMTAPTVSRFSPADGAAGVAPGSNFVVTFSETITRGVGNIVLKNGAGATIESFAAAGSARLAFSGSTLTINPTHNLANNTGYRLEFAAGTVMDLAGNRYAGTSGYNFNTNYLPSGVVAVTGAPVMGQTLRADASGLADADGLGTQRYQWNANGSAIRGANSSALVLTQGLAGKTLTVAVSYSDGHGTSERVNSASIFLGTSGNDTLTGGSGPDMLAGGAGNDLYRVNASRNVPTESAGGGIDTVSSQISWTLGAHLENLTLTGGNAISGTGNTLANVIIGNGGNNTLSGRGGLDTLTGGAGADRFKFVRANEGMDTITDFNPVQGDKLVFVSPNFANLDLGGLVPSRFRSNSSGVAVSVNDRFIFATDSRILRFDPDGSGPGLAVAVARLNFNTLSASAIQLVAA